MNRVQCCAVPPTLRPAVAQGNRARCPISSRYRNNRHLRGYCLAAPQHSLSLAQRRRVDKASVGLRPYSVWLHADILLAHPPSRFYFWLRPHPILLPDSTSDVDESSRNSKYYIHRLAIHLIPFSCGFAASEVPAELKSRVEDGYQLHRPDHLPVLPGESHLGISGCRDGELGSVYPLLVL